MKVVNRNHLFPSRTFCLLLAFGILVIIFSNGNADDLRSGEFDYLAQKVYDAPFIEYPFRHLDIHSFLTEEHWNTLMTLDEVHFPPALSHDDLILQLEKRNYHTTHIGAGITTDKKSYLEHMRNGSYMPDTLTCTFDNCFDGVIQTNTTGLVYRLEPQEAFTKSLLAYFNSDAFLDAVFAKFSVSRPFNVSRSGFFLHKYLKGYDICPHPDIAAKKLTLIFNINKDGAKCASDNVNTILYSILPEYAEKFRSVAGGRYHYPWKWFAEAKRIDTTNRFFVFAPLNDSFHSITIRYDHLPYQRTIVTGNIYE